MRTKSYNKKKMLSLLLVPVFACTLTTMGGAAPCPGTISGVSQTTACTLTGSDSLTLSNTGKISVNVTPSVTIDDGATGVTIDNSGQILFAGGYNAAILGDADATGTTIINRAGALISATAGSAGATVTAIHFDGILDGELTNAGTITAGFSSAVTSANASFSDAYPTRDGLYAMGLSGLLNNTGEISATLDLAATDPGTDAYAQVEGHYVTGLWLDSSATLAGSGNIDAGASLINSGTISGVMAMSAKAGGPLATTADAYATGSDAYGVYVENALDGTLDNSGLIEASIDANATATADDVYAYAYANSATGLYLGSVGSGGELTNSGTISAAVTANANIDGAAPAGDAYAYGYDAYAVGIGNDLDGKLENLGLIEASIDATATGAGNDSYVYAYASNAYGLYLDNIGAAAELINSGTINAAVSATANSGNTEASNATAYAYGYYAYGIYADANLKGTLNNVGLIDARVDLNAKATGEDAYAYAYGSYATAINLENIDKDGELLNSGTISAAFDSHAMAKGTTDADAKAYGWYAYGIQMDELYGKLDNSGTIEARLDVFAEATADNGTGYAYASGYGATGLSLADVNSDGSLTNSGSIGAAVNIQATAKGTTDATAVASGSEAWGIDLDDLYAELNNSGTISGRLDVFATATADNAYADATGTYATGIDMQDITNGGSLVNTGLIDGSITVSATANGKWYAEADIYTYASDAFGIDMEDIYGTLDNSGTISASIEAVTIAKATEGDASAGNNEDGSLQYATGIEAGTVWGGAELINSGTISAAITGKATATGTNAAHAYIYNLESAAGIEMADLYGKLDNSGLISAQINATATARADTAHATVYSASDVYGLYVDYVGPGAELINSGTISAAMDVQANAYGSYSADASIQSATYLTGIDLDNLGGVLDNSGTISALLNASATASAEDRAVAKVNLANSVTGVEMDDIQATGSLTNSGLISAVIDARATATATGGPSYGLAYASADASKAIGLEMVEIGPNASLVNSGTISGQIDVTVKAAGTTDAEAYAYGEYAYGLSMNDHTIDVTGRLENNGTISAIMNVNATATAANAFASIETADNIYGIDDVYGLSIGATLTNTGEISATLDATAKADGVSKATAYLYNSYAAGLYVNNAIERDALLENSGTISANVNLNAEATAEDYARAYASGNSAAGIDFNDYEIHKAGKLSNSGTISAQMDVTAKAVSTATADASAYGWYVYGLDEVDDIRGELVNTGTVSAELNVDATATADDAYAYASGSQVDGYYFDNDIQANASMVNSGEISASLGVAATAIGVTTATASAYKAYSIAGIDMDDHIYENAILDNSGTITASMTADATATASGGKAVALVDSAYNAYGITFSDIYMDGALTNSGSISAMIDVAVKATGTTSASAYATASSAAGIEFGSLEGTLDNSGTITAAINSTVESAASAGSAEAHNDVYHVYGIDEGGKGSTGDLINSGPISASADVTAKATGTTTATATAEATSVSGVSLRDFDGLMDNMDTISGTAKASAEAYGATADGSADASAYGVSLSRLDDNGQLNNSGSISAQATALGNAGITKVTAGASGVSMNDLHGTLDNSGTISAVAKATSLGTNAKAEAAGVIVEDVTTFSGTLNNSGLISAEAYASAVPGETGTEFARAAGVHALNFTGTLNNSGTIKGKATLPQEGYSVAMESTDLATETGVVNNMAGGVLDGNLYIGGMVTINNDGLIAIPAGASAEIEGTINQSVDGVLGIGVLDETNYADVLVTGTANFAEGTAIGVDLEEGVVLGGGEVLYNVVTAGALPTSFTTLDNSGLFSFTAVIDGLTVDLNVDRTSVVDLVNAYGSGGVAGVGALLDSMFDNGAPSADMQTLLSALSRIETEAGVVRAINSLVPVLNGDTSLAIIDSLRSASDIVSVRQQGGPGLSSGDETAADKNVWGKIYGTKASQDKDGGALGYDADTYGIMIGVDAMPNASYQIGAALGYSQTDADNEYNQESETDSFNVILYGTYNLDDATALNVQAGYGIHDTDTKRNIGFMNATANGSYDSSSIQFGANLEREYVISEKTTLTPSIRADYVYVDSDSYTETGAGAYNQIIGGSDADELILGLDGELEYSFAADKMFSFNLGIGYDALADQGSVTSAWVGTPNAAFKTEGVDPSEFVYVTGLGLTFGDESALQLDLRYDLEGRSEELNQSVSLKINKAF